MSFFIKKNPYDKFKIKSSKYLQRPLTNKEFRSISSTKNSSQRLILSKILKGTKSILRNKNKFSGYMNEYQSIVTKNTFKRPDIQNYPLLKKECSSMIPIKCQKIERQKSKKKIINIFHKTLNYRSFKEKFRQNVSMSMSSIENKHKKYDIKYYTKKKDKEKLLLFSDFFYKWNKNKEYESNNQYSNLSYDENNIFYNDYSNLIKEKLQYLQKNKLENLQKKLKINILDSRKKKIRLQLISMKLIFEPINTEKSKCIEKDYNFEDYQEIYNYKNVISEEDDKDDKDFNGNNKSIITFPLSYVFLFYINGIDYFKDILLASIKFSNDYQKINFKEDEIYIVLRKEKDNKKIRLQIRVNNRAIEHKGSIKLFPKVNNILKKSISIKLSNKVVVNNLKEELKKEPDKEKNVGFSINNANNDNNNTNDVNSLYKTNKKIVTIHANPDLRNNEKRKKDSKKKEIKYTEYCFIWETPNRTYKVRMIMPIIIFWSEHVKKNIIAYCDKDLFLFLFQNNFVNWDYYILNYLFSIKIFRQIILSSLSFYSNIFMNNAELSSFTERERKKDFFSQSPNRKKFDNSKISSINEKTIILNTNKKIYNQLNENNESYKFFYTDNFSINSIIDFHSYHIFIEYDKLNSNICWEFAINFKQMNYLSNINKYESLETFLPKIIQTNFEDGNISIDFSIFEYFNTKIFEHHLKEEKENCKTSTNLTNINFANENIKKKIYNDMLLVIKTPFIIVEQYVKSRFLSNNVQKMSLNSNFINVLGNCKNISWSKKILKFLNHKNGNYDHNKSSLNLIKEDNCYSFNDDSKKENNDRYDDYINNYHRYKKYSKSLHYKKKKTTNF